MASDETASTNMRATRSTEGAGPVAVSPFPTMEGQCLLDVDDTPITVGVVGAGPGFMSIMEIIHSVEYHDYLPEMQLAGVAEIDGPPARLEYLQALGAPVYPTWQALYTAHPDISLIIELTCNNTKLQAMRLELPARVSLVDQPAAVFFCGLHNMLQTSQHCRERLTREQLLMQTIMNEVSEDIMLLDAQGRVVDLNRHAAANTGQPRELLRGQPCWTVDHLSPNHRFCESKDEKCPFHVTLQTGKAAEALMPRVMDDGELRYYRVYSYPIHSPQGTVTNVLLMRRDITDRTRREQAQQQQEKLAVVGEMSMFLAHEIRNPLFAIAGFSNRLRKAENLEPDQQEKLEIIVQEAKRLESMLGTILDFAKPASPDGDPGVADIVKVVNDTMAFLQLSYGRQGVALQLIQVGDVPLVRGDAAQLTQCLVNCIKNAVEAMQTAPACNLDGTPLPPGQGGQVHIRLGLDETEQGLVHVEILDDGPGMDDEALKRAFSPFYSTKDDGRGLGLATVRKVVEEFGGTATARNRDEGGLAVSIKLLAA